MRVFIMLLALLACLGAGDCFAQKSKKPVKIDKKTSVGRLFGDENRNAQFYYSRANITIMRKSIPADIPLPMPWLGKETAPNPALVYDVEMRDGMSLYNQNGWFDMSSYTDRTGLMLAFSESTIQPIMRSAQYAPVDILFIDKQGKITQIVPNILLSDLEENIIPESPILAFLFIKGGSSAELYINVGDEVQYSLFKKPPVILNAPREVPRKPLPEAPAVKEEPLINKARTQKAPPKENIMIIPEADNESWRQTESENLSKRIK